MDGLRAIAEVHRGVFRLTPNQNLIISDVAPEDRAAVEELLRAHGLDETVSGRSGARNHTAATSAPKIGAVALTMTSMDAVSACAAKA